MILGQDLAEAMDVLEERAVAEARPRTSPSEGGGGGPAMEVDIEEVRQEAGERFYWQDHRLT